MEFPIRELLRHRDSFEPLAWWENRFGKTFPSVRPFLFACEGHMAEFFPSPQNPSVQFMVQEAGFKYRAVPPEGGDDIILDWEDVQAHRLDFYRLCRPLRKTFNVQAGRGRKHNNLHYLGRCQSSRDLRHVYICKAHTASAAHKAVEHCTDPGKFGCILFATRHDRSAKLLRERGISSVSLRECLSLTQKGFTGTCPGACAGCTCTNPLENRLETIEKSVLPDATRGSKTRNAASAGGRARAALYKAKYDEARRFIREYHRKYPSACFTQALRRAARHLHLSERTLKTHVKKGDFADW